MTFRSAPQRLPDEAWKSGTPRLSKMWKQAVRPSAVGFWNLGHVGFPQEVESWSVELWTGIGHRSKQDRVSVVAYDIDQGNVEMTVPQCVSDASSASSTWGNSWHVGFVPLGQKPQRLQPRGATCLRQWSDRPNFTASDNIRHTGCRKKYEISYIRL